MLDRFMKEIPEKTRVIVLNLWEHDTLPQLLDICILSMTSKQDVEMKKFSNWDICRNLIAGCEKVTLMVEGH